MTGLPRLVVAALAVLLALGGCTGIPTGGPVREVPADGELDQEAVRYAPAPPNPGASPQQVVTGFLDAMLAYPRSTGVAERYLTEEAAERWNPAAGTVVYAAAEVGAPRAARTGVRVRLTTTDVARLDARGRLGVTEQGRDRSLSLQRIDGEWRIDSLPDGQLVTERYFDDYFRPFDLAFFDQPGRRIVPSVVHVPIGEQLPTALVTSLARGPDDDTAGLRSFLPALSDVRPSVPVRADGVAEVDLGPGAADLPEADLDRLAAQVAWTLDQVPTVRGVRLSAGATLMSPGGQAVQTSDTWRRFGPRTATSGPFVLSGATPLELIGIRTREVEEGWAGSVASAAQVAVGRASVASVPASGDVVVVRGRTGGTERVRVPATDVLTVLWLPDDVLLVIDRPDGLRVRVLDGERVRLLRTGLDGRQDVTSVAVAPDGARYAATLADGGLLVGSVTRRTDDVVRSLGPVVRVPVDEGAAGSVAWVADSRLAYLARTEVGAQVVEVLVDGTSVSGPGAGGPPVLPGVTGAQVVASGERRWVLDDEGQLWALVENSSWVEVVGRVRAVSPPA